MTSQRRAELLKMTSLGRELLQNERRAADREKEASVVADLIAASPGAVDVRSRNAVYQGMPASVAHEIVRKLPPTERDRLGLKPVAA